MCECGCWMLDGARIGSVVSQTIHTNIDGVVFVALGGLSGGRIASRKDHEFIIKEVVVRFCCSIFFQVVSDLVERRILKELDLRAALVNIF